LLGLYRPTHSIIRMDVSDVAVVRESRPGGAALLQWVSGIRKAGQHADSAGSSGGVLKKGYTET